MLQSINIVDLLLHYPNRLGVATWGSGFLLSDVTCCLMQPNTQGAGVVMTTQ